MEINFNNLKIAVIGGHETTKIFINVFKSLFKNKLDIFYYKPVKAKNLVLYSNLKSEIKTKENFFKFTKIKDVENQMVKNRYDFLFAFGLSQIIPNKIIRSVNKNIIGFHPTFLPHGKGRSSSAWNIRIKKHGGCSFFAIDDENADSGRIIYRKKININNTDNAQSYSEKYLKLFNKMIFEILTKPEIYLKKRDNKVKVKKTSYYNILKIGDSFIDWSMKTNIIERIIKSSSFPHPGSYTFINHKLYKIEGIIKNNKNYKTFHYAQPGTILSKNGFNYEIKTGDGKIGIQINKNLKINERFTVINPYLLFKILQKLKINL